jgi:hypothetical protein
MIVVDRIVLDKMLGDLRDASRIRHARREQFQQRVYRSAWVVFDAFSGQLITALLQPGRAHAAKGATSLLTRLIRAIPRRERFWKRIFSCEVPRLSLAVPSIWPPGRPPPRGV